MELPQLPKADLTFHDVFDEEENKEAQTVHHIRANSSIMQVKKILGASSSASLPPLRGPPGDWVYGQLVVRISR